MSRMPWVNSRHDAVGGQVAPKGRANATNSSVAGGFPGRHVANEFLLRSRCRSRHRQAGFLICPRVARRTSGLVRPSHRGKFWG
jgi:hypothetical protein